MFEVVGMLIALIVFCGLSVIAGFLFGVGAWLFCWGLRRPKALIAMAALIPPLSVAYMVIAAICLTIVVPNQPDQFFGDFSEPLPNGYLLKGLGKMPDYAFFDTSKPGMIQPQTLGSVRSLEEDGPIIYGAYGHLNQHFGEPATGDQGYFVFDTRSGKVENFNALQDLNSRAGHPVHLIESQLFRSQEPRRKRLRQVENVIYFGPPVFAALLCLVLLARYRLSGTGAIEKQLDGSSITAGRFPRSRPRGFD